MTGGRRQIVYNLAMKVRNRAFRTIPHFFCVRKGAKMKDNLE